MLLPVLLVVIISTAVGNFFGPSLYDVQLMMKKLPFMPPFKPYGRKTVKDIMRHDVQYLTVNTTYTEVENALRSSSLSSLPLVQSFGTLVYVMIYNVLQLTYTIIIHR